MKHVTTVIIGAGQSGLAFSKQLSGRGIDHVLLERGRVAHSWRTERWDTLRLLTPNWQSRLPGYRYTGSDPDGYMTMKEVVDFLQGYADFTGAPVEEETTVKAVRPIDGGYDVVTNRGTWRCRSVMIASGACNIATTPKAAEGLPSSVRGITPMEYRNPDALEEGGVMVVGASATGVQLASEIQASGRPVTLCVGEHVRVPRMYRARDITWWMPGRPLAVGGPSQKTKGGASARLSTVTVRAASSTAPVGRSGFTVPSGRGRTSPSTWSTHSRPM